jgi:hypothetical protein
MPGLPIIEDVVRVAVTRDDGGGRTASNVMHFHSAGFDEGTLWAALQANVDRAMWDCVWNGYTVITVDMLPLDGVSATHTYTPDTPLDWTGEAAGDCIPAVAGLLKLRTGVRGRSHRGRLFLGAVGESIVSQGFLATGTRDEMELKWNEFQNGMHTAGFDQLVASYTEGTALPVANSVMEIAVATQRRRQDQLRH